MTEVVVRPLRTAAWRRVRGFTLIEVMITVAIIAILAAIALPNYNEYITRSRLIEGTTALADARQKTEQYFLDTRDYKVSCANAVTAFNNAPSTKNFAISCPASSASSYTLQAAGLGFTYQVDDRALKTTAAVAAGWNKPSPNDCWAIRKSGACQ